MRARSSAAWSNDSIAFDLETTELDSSSASSCEEQSSCNAGQHGVPYMLRLADKEYSTSSSVLESLVSISVSGLLVSSVGSCLQRWNGESLPVNIALHAFAFALLLACGFAAGDLARGL